MSKNFPGFICADLPILNISFLDITPKNSVFCRLLWGVPQIMETGCCAKCIKTADYNAVTNRKNGFFTNVYSLPPAYHVRFPGFCSGGLHNPLKSIQKNLSEKGGISWIFPLWQQTGDKAVAFSGRCKGTHVLGFCMFMHQGAEKFFPEAREKAAHPILYIIGKGGAALRRPGLFFCGGGPLPLVPLLQVAEQPVEHHHGGDGQDYLGGELGIGQAVEGEEGV